MNEQTKKMFHESNGIRKEIKDNPDNGSYKRWLEKEVLESFILFTPNEETIKNVSLPKDGQLLLNNNVVYNNEYSLEIKANTNVENKFSRPTCGIKIKCDKFNISQFNRVSIWININSVGYENFYFHFLIGNRNEVHTASIIPNKWTRVMWELDHTKDNEIDEITITPFLFGCPPEALEEVSFYIGDVILEKVKPDYVLGWDLDDRIAYCHSGYFVNSEKQALTQVSNEKKFYLLNENNDVVYEKEVFEINEKIGKYYLIDFSDFNNKGNYKLKIDNRITPNFIIDDNPLMSSIIKSVNFLRLLRCGEDIEGVHSACHLNCKSVDENNNSVPNFGGWHDAGDLSQFEICTAEMANAILDLSLKVKDEELKNRLLEEEKVGITWLLRTIFKDGSRALAVSYSIWRQNELQSDDKTVCISKAEKGPFESFCSASALAVAARCYDDPIFSAWCLRVAKKDFECACKWYKEGIHTKRWGKNIDSQVCGHGLLAACELYLVTKDSSYLEIAIEYSQVIMKCQEKEYLDNSNIRGFFYEDVDHKYVYTFEHRGHEQSPVQGLCRLLEIYPNVENRSEILDCLKLYREYILNTIGTTYPYNLIPGHVYSLNKLNEERFTIPSYMCTKEEGMEILKRQIKKGIKINDEWYLRIMPIAVQRRGFHATLLSKTKAVSMIASLFNDGYLKQIVINQLEWILGKNPFASSTMYGEGYNYHPLYVAFSRQMVGSLPVGIMTFDDYDLPYWPTFNNAVFKEIWGHTTGKYLWVIADII